MFQRSRFWQASLEVLMAFHLRGITEPVIPPTAIYNEQVTKAIRKHCESISKNAKIICSIPSIFSKELDAEDCDATERKEKHVDTTGREKLTLIPSPQTSALLSSTREPSPKSEKSLQSSVEKQVQRLMQPLRKLIILPLLQLVIQEHDLSDDKLYMLTSHLFCVRCDACCSVIGSIINQIFFFGSVAFESEIVERWDQSVTAIPYSRFYYVGRVLDEMNIRKVCCRRKFLAFVVEPFDPCPVPKLNKIPAAGHSRHLGTLPRLQATYGSRTICL